MPPSRPASPDHSARSGSSAAGGATSRIGRAQQTLAAATAFSALPLGLEIYFEHFRGSFGDKWMWTPVALSPGADRGRRGRRALRAGGPDLAAGRLGALLRSTA